MINHSKRIPSIRQEVSFIPVRHNHQNWLLVHDQLGIVTPNMAFPAEVKQLLAFFTGSFLWDSLAKYGVVGEALAQFELVFNELDQHGVLHSKGFEVKRKQIEEAFLAAKTRQPICNGNTYPDDIKLLSKRLDEALVQIDSIPLVQQPKALFAPHIDFKVDLEIYAKSFKPLKMIKPKHIYLIGTSHYSGMHKEYDSKPYQFSTKSYVLPGRLLQNNVEKTSRLFDLVKDYGATDFDLSHRVEHSLELHAVWASHIWKHDFTITPILVGSFEDTLYMKESVLELQIEKFSKALESVLTEDDFVLISGDLSHIGKKFGDDIPAMDFYSEVQQHDREILLAAKNGNTQQVYELLRSNLDAFRMCGFPPLISVLASNSFRNGVQIGYASWDEKETESLVSFGSILYF